MLSYNHRGTTNTKEMIFMSSKYTPEAIFNMVMDYIDECITDYQMSSADISDKMLESTGIHSSEFNKILKNLNFTYPSLSKYIPARRAYLALDHTIKNPTQSIQSIANFFGYADSSIFSREVKKHFKITPSEARKQKYIPHDNKLSFTNHKESTKNYIKEENNMNEDIYEALKDNRIDYYIQLMESINDTYNVLDGNSIHLISQLADMYDVSVCALSDAIADTIFDLKTSQELSPKVEHCMDLGITLKELNEVCEFYDCKYYELNDFLIDHYRELKH